MAGDTVITVVGNLTADPEIRFTQSGAAVANFTVASTPRIFDRQSNEWKDGPTLFMRCSVWREMAENVAETLRKGMRVIVQGRLTQRSWETDQGERRTAMELQVDEIGPSLRRAKAQVQRNEPSQQNGYGGQSSGGEHPEQSYSHGGQPAQQNYGQSWGGPPPQQGGWAQGPAGAQQNSWPTNSQEPPF